MKYLYGPVASRRYGRSLGIDLAPLKTCSFNCVFCQLGNTAATTVTPADSPPIADVLCELAQWLDSGEQTDVITLAGSGEPTLHSRFGEVLDFIRGTTRYPSLLLSNGSLFFQEPVRLQAARADIVKLSLHSWDQDSFMRIARADRALAFDRVIEGYRLFRAMYCGRIDLEVFVIPGVNDSVDAMRRIAEIAAGFAPDSVFLNSAVRPPADSSVKPVSPNRIAELAALFGSSALRPAPAPERVRTRCYSDDALTELVARHPATVSQLAAQFAIPRERLRKRLRTLETQGLIKLSKRGGALFVLPPSSAEE